MLHQTLRFLVLTLLSAILVSACYERREGCLDIAATNFDVDADVACPDNCCTYPRLQLKFSHKVKSPDRDTFYNLVYNDSVYTVDGTNFFRINEIRFYISDVKLVQSNGQTVGVQDEVEIALPGIGDTTYQTIENNFALVTRSSFAASVIGALRPEGNYVGIRFNVGVSTPANHADPLYFPNGHPLRVTANSGMHWSVDSGYVFNSIALFRDTIASDTIPTILEIGTDDYLRTVNLDFPFTLREGFNAVITLRIDYLKWFEGIQIRTDSEATLIEKIVENVANSFTVLEVAAE